MKTQHSLDKPALATIRSVGPAMPGRLYHPRNGKDGSGIFHKLLVRIAVMHSEIVSWWVTVGTDFSLTVNFAGRKARAEHDSG